jgi:hypothetical protein
MPGQGRNVEFAFHNSDDDGARRAPVIPKAALRILLLAILAAGLWLEWRHAGALATNLLVVGGFFLVCAFAPRRDRRRLGPPFPRNRWLVFFVVGGVALAAAWPTLALPYLADDHFFLEIRGNTGSLWKTLTAMPDGEIWFRPVAWFPWRYYHKYFPADATAAHAVSVGLFVVNAALVVSALRRCGAPRGAAAAAAILFAASPAALETTAWLTNQCSLFAGVFAAAAIATIPFGRPRAARMALPALLAGLAFLSKEETFLLPALAVLVLARFRVRRLPRAALAAWPLFLVLGAVVAARAWMLGGLGGHRDPASHQSQLFLGWMSGPRAALESEAPARYFLPMRISLFPEGAYRWAPLLPLVLLAYGGGSSLARRCAPRALWIAALAIAPMAPLLPIGDMIDEARWLYMPTIGLSLASAALLAGGRLRGVAAWVPILGFAAVSWAVARSDFFAWREAGAVMERCLHALMPRLRSATDGSTGIVAGLPNQVEGAFCFLTGKSYALTRAARPVNVRFPNPSAATGAVSPALLVDPVEGSVRDWLEGIPSLRLKPGDSYTFLPATRVRDRLILETFGGERRVAPKFASFWSHYDDGLLVFPIMEVPAGGTFTWQMEGGFLQPGGRLLAPRVIVTWRSKGRLERTRLDANEALRLPDDVERLRLDLALDQGLILEMRSFTVRTAGP